MLGLLALHKINGDKQLLDSVMRGADYLIDSQRKMKELPPDVWFMQVLEILFKSGNQRKYADHAIALAEAIIGNQYGEGSTPGYEGGFGPQDPSAASTAARVEGLLAAYRIAHRMKHPKAPKIAESIRAAVEFQLSKQFTPENSYFFPRRERVAGAFPESMTSMSIRIDYVQHNISALVGAARTLY
jgi:hypothetical protein